MTKEAIILRPARETDLPFIFRSVLMGTYHGNKYGKSETQDVKAPVDFFSSIDQDTFMKSYHKHIENILHRPNISIAVAALESNPDVILGFSIFEDSILHFVFVKPAWRKIGIAKLLVPANTEYVTGFTRVGDIIRRKKNLKFNPWL